MRSATLWIVVAMGFSLPISTALDSLLVVSLMICWVASGNYLEKLTVIRGNPLALAAVAFALLHLVGAVYSIGPRDEILAAVSKAAFLLLIPVLVSLEPEAKWLRRSLIAFLLALAITLMLSFLIWWGFAPPGTFKGYPYDAVVFKLKITHSVLMAYGAYILAVASREIRDLKWRIGLAAGAVLAAFNVLVMVWGRTGQLVLLALFVFLLVAWYRWRGFLAAAAAMVAIGGAAFLIPTSALHQRTVMTLKEITDWRAGKPPTLANTRLETWTNSLAIIQRHPGLGAGTGSFATAYAQRVNGTGMTVAQHAESQYLYTAAELGALGLAALLALFAVQWRWATHLEQRARTDLARGLVILMVIGSLFNPFLRDHTEALFYAWLSGLLFAGGTVSHSANGDS